MTSSENPSEGRVAYILARVNAGLATEWARIDELAASLEQMFKDVRALGEPYISPERRSTWDEAWRDLRKIFDTLRSLDAEAQKRFTADDPSSDPLQPWSEFIHHEDDFV